VNVLVITNCTNRKGLTPASDLQARHLPPGEVGKVAANWWARVGRDRNRMPARSLYKGRAFAEAVRAAQLLGAELVTVSAGLGLVSGTLPVPAYSLTISSGSDDSILAKTGATAGDWWRALRAAAGQSDWPDADLILVALSTPYLSMVADDLSAWPAERRNRLRIFTGAWPANVAPPLRDAVMPYDRRFDAIGGPNPGIQGDFAQRVLRHFAEFVLPTTGRASLEEHRASVEAVLGLLKVRERPNRTKVPDETITQLILENWSAAEGRSSVMLRLLRDQLDVACEQGRFKDLFNAVASQERLL